VRNSILAGSLDAERIAVPLVRELQYGVSNEADLLSAFTTDGALRLNVPVGGIGQFVGNALHRWERRQRHAFSLIIRR
jgi:hypothetical protein